MATTSIFGLTSNSNSAIPGDVSLSGWPSSRYEPHSASDRYARAGLTGRYSYPHEAWDEGFNIPSIYFKFTDAFGGRISTAPKLALKMPPNFNLTGFSDYARTENIFATSSEVYNNILDTAIKSKQQEIKDTNTGGDATGVQKLVDQVAKVGLSAAEAFKYSWQKAFANLEGWGASAGLSNLNQYEFMNRQAVNPMAQLLYRGPQMRRYQLPFVMHPKSSIESNNIQKILSVFRLASSPSVPSTSGTSIAGINIGAGNAFTFGYPHLTQFDVLFTNRNNNVTTIYRSKLCAIESVSIDYGSQKMTFFEDGRPTEVTLTVQLTEVTPRTLGDEYGTAMNSQITLK
jgi:hypothetical protein